LRCAASVRLDDALVVSSTVSTTIIGSDTTSIAAISRYL